MRPHLFFLIFEFIRITLLWESFFFFNSQDHSLSLSRLPFFTVFVLTILLVPSIVQVNTSFLIIAYWDIVIKVMCQIASGN